MRKLNHKLNLTPTGVLRKKDQEKLKFVYACILFALLIVIFLPLYYINNRITKIDHKIKEIKKKQSSLYAKTDTDETVDLVLKDLESRKSSYKQVMENRFNRSFYIENVVSLKPADLLMHKFDFNKEGILIVEGYGPDNVSVAQMLSQLEKAKLFDEINLNFIRYVSNTFGYKGYAFEITLIPKRFD
jgi:hypothetical protein